MRFILFIIFSPLFLWANLPKNPALLVAKSPLLAERNLSSDIRKVVFEGEVVEVLEIYQEEGLDKDQNQTFPWYFVKINSGESGWVFGNNVAVQTHADSFPQVLPKDISQQQLHLGDVFGETIQWFAAVHGHDAGVYEKGLYSEIYLVLTAASGKSLYYPCAQTSSAGQTKLHHFHTMDLTNDEQPELILDMEACEKGVSFGQRWVEVLTIQSGFFQKIYSEELSLYTSDGLPSPVRYKRIEFDPQSIRIQYLDFTAPNQPVPEEMPVGFEHSLVHHTHFLTWNPLGRTFEELYSPLSQSISATVRQGSVPLYRVPDYSIINHLALKSPLKIFRFFEKIDMNNGEKSMKPWYFVKTKDGQTGYIEARYIELSGGAGIDLLSKYASQKPLSYTDWSVEGDFVLFLDKN